LRLPIGGIFYFADFLDTANSLDSASIPSLHFDILASEFFPTHLRLLGFRLWLWLWLWLL
jgi:hypothetical protein